MHIHGELARGARTALFGIWVLVSAAGGDVRPAATAGDDARLLLPGLIVEEGDLPRDASGGAVVESIPGVPPFRPLDATVAGRLEALTAERDRIGARSAAGAVFETLPPRPAAGAAPPRLDSGDPDPERLRAAPAAPTSR